MSINFFIVGAVIFIAYACLLVWIIFDQSKKQRQEGNGTIYDEGDVDLDGIGNQGRVPNKKTRR